MLTVGSARSGPIAALGRGAAREWRGADFYLPQRLCFSSKTEWRDIDWSELSKAVRFGAASFLLDRRVISTLDSGVRETLIARGFGWSTTIRDAALSPDASGDLTATEKQSLAKIRAFDVRDDASYEYGFGYYMALLSIRRQFARVIRDRVRKDYGRDVVAGEIGAIAEHYGGPGARRRADHWEANMNDPLVFVGDELLVYGTAYAVVEGTDVVFLTRDSTFLDQFVALMSMLGSDYVASQYARTFAGNPEAFPDYSRAEDQEGAVVKALGRATAGNIPGGWENAILPRRPYLINMHCWLLGENKGDSVQLAALTYGCERGMHNLLRIKGATLGKNVEHLDGRNIRAAHGPLGKEATITLWQDRMIDIGTIDFPKDDRLDLRVGSIAAADIVRIHNSEAPLTPWYEEST